MSKCINCSANKFIIITQAKERRIIKCQNCGLITVTPMPTNPKLNQLINQVGQSLYQEFESQDQIIRQYFQNHLKKLARYQKQGLLLDVGCAQGALLKAASNRYQVFGLEMAKEAVKLCRQQGLNVSLGDLSTLPKSKKFQIITAFQLIEHLKDPKAFFEQAYEHLSPGGIIYLVTPDQRGFLARLMGRFWFEYYNKEHLFFFTRSTLSQMLRATGFNVISVQTEHGRGGSVDYIWNRLANYYYSQPSLMNFLLKLSRGIFMVIGSKIIIKEPWVDIVIMAQKPVDYKQRKT